MPAWPSLNAACLACMRLSYETLKLWQPFLCLYGSLSADLSFCKECSLAAFSQKECLKSICGLQGATIHTSDGLVMELMPRVHNELNGTPILEELAMPASAPVA